MATKKKKTVKKKKAVTKKAVAKKTVKKATASKKKVVAKKAVKKKPVDLPDMVEPPTPNITYPKPTPAPAPKPKVQPSPPSKPVEVKDPNLFTCSACNTERYKNNLTKVSADGTAFICGACQ